MINKLYSLQYLKAIAALFVVYSHTISFIGNGNSSQSNFYYLKSFGAIGVDIFFVICGFIIAYISKDFIGKSDAKEFLIKRVIRINPSYFLVIGMIFIEKNYVKFNNKIILLLGDASFSIYLIHTVVLSFFNKFYYKFNSVPEDILIIIYIILSTIISILYYRNIESKISYYLLKKLKKS